MEIWKQISVSLLYPLFLFNFFYVIVGSSNTIIFASMGSRSIYSFDIFSLPLDYSNSELRLTDGHSLNYNGHFPSAAAISTILPRNSEETSAIYLLYSTERDGVSTIYLDYIYTQTPEDVNGGRRDILEVSTELTHRVERVQVPLLSGELINSYSSGGRVSMKDRPSLVGDSLIYVSTHEDPGVSRTSWAAVYSTQLSSGLTRRLTPYGVADFSPAVSPSGVRTAVASLGDKGWDGEVEELGTDINVFLTRDGSERVKVAEHGGWPTWADDSTIYFHRRGKDGWWSIYKAILPANGSINVNSVETHRVTPPGLHSFTPSASIDNKNLIAVATRRPGSEYRHVTSLRYVGQMG